MTFGVFCSPVQIVAQDGANTIVVQIVDAVSHLPVRGNVKFTGPLSTTQRTNADGTFELREVPPGSYGVQAGAAGYKSSDVVAIVLAPGERSVVHIELAKRESALKTIGRVSTTRPPARPYSELSRATALSRLSENVYDALGKLPGVALDTTGDAGQSQALFGLEGHDPTQTAVTLDGVPLNTPGSAFDASALGSDLMSSASVSFGPARGFSGGSVDFRTALPTRYPLLDVVTRAGASGSSSIAALARGSAGSLGFVAGGSAAFADLATTGQLFPDWSGDVAHRGASGSRTALAKLQYLVTREDVVTATYLRTNRDFTPFCPFGTTVTPCGFGNEVSGSGNSSVAMLRLLGQRGRFTYDASAFQTNVSSATDLSARVIAGSPFPAASALSVAYGGVNARLGFDVDAKDRLSLSFLGASTNQHLTQTAMGSSTAQTGVARNAIVDLALTRDLSRATRIALGLSRRRGLSGTASSVSARGDLRLDANSTLSGSVDVGSSAGVLSESGITSTPEFLNYVCSGHVAYGRLGTIVSDESSTSTERLAYTRATPAGVFSLIAFDQVARNVPTRFPVNATVLNGSPGFGTFLSQANQIAHLPPVCPQMPQLTAADIYLFGLVNGLDTRYTGVRGIASVGRGPLRFEPFVAVLRARLTSSDPLVTAPQSILHSGQQLFGVPYVQAGGILDYKSGPVELAANYHYYSANNSLAAGAFGTIDLGAVFSAKRGTVTARMTNLTNAQAGTFAVVGTQSAATTAGMMIPLVSRPFPGRRVSVDYSVSLGVAERGGPSARVFGSAPEATPPPLTGLPGGPVSAPFTLRNNAPACDFQAAKQAEDLVAPVRRYYDYRQSHPNEAAPPPPVPAGMSASYHDVPGGYELEYSIQNLTTLSVIIKCLQYRTVDEKDLTAAGLVGSATNYTGISFLFSSKYGFILPSTKERQSPPQYYTIGQGVPRDPFALTTAPSCSAKYRDRATVLLATIRDELGRRGLDKPFSTEAFDVKVGTLNSLPWVALEFKSQFDLAAVLNCGHISQGTKTELGDLNLGGAALPYLAFTPTYGFFFLKL
ncbi:MAG TPA: TonB-dependent receptor [Candidatus Elarobacter sp.]|jgi:hypothetical protein|nr:TonB-dependent receptor [Candidatus Elarobacter sp.]